MRRFLLSLFVLYCSTSIGAESDFTVFPRMVSLQGRESHSKVLVQRLRHSDNSETFTVAEQFSSGVHFQVLDTSIARLKDSTVYPVSDGSTELIVQVDGYPRMARIPIAVRGTSQQSRWQFGAHVESVFARNGCNSGACHGALAGKGGFRLSLLGYDWQADLYAITGQNQGRRIEPADPVASLLLTKPSMQVPHKGGLRLAPDSADFRLIAEWISAGAIGPSPSDAALRGIEVLPNQIQALEGKAQSLIVRAQYEDGRVEDVTRWAKFNSTNASVLEVDEFGEVRAVGQGRGAIVAWFASRLAIATIDVPYRANSMEMAEELSADSESNQAFAGQNATQARRDQFQPQNFVDEILVKEWQALGLGPSAVCDDLTYLRRAHLDVTGTLPDAQTVMQLITSGQPLNRQQLVNEILASPQYIDYWAYLWSDLLLVNGNLLRPKAVESFYKWIRSQVEGNVRWDEFARSIVLAKGDSLKNGATNFYAIHQTPEAMTENVCLAFMGLSIECAKCHNHPLERWTNDQYFAMANLFARVRAKGWGGDPRNGEGDRTLIVFERGDLIQPSRGVPQPPAPLDQPPLDPEDPSDRRQSLADWLTGPENQYFSRAIVNRVWANFFGIGLVDPVDDLRMSNPACSEELMTGLTQFLEEHDYDLKALMRLILTSQVYQLSSKSELNNASDQRFFCRYYPRRLTAEVLHDAIVKVTNVPTKFDKIEFVGADKQPTEFYPLGTTALGLFDSAVSSYFLQTFGRHQRRITCDCERSNEATVIQALHLNNGDTLNAKLSHPDCVISSWLSESLPLETIIEKSYLQALCRLPSESEILKTQEEWQAASGAGVPLREFTEDLLWSLMSGKEFLFAH